MISYAMSGTNSNRRHHSSRHSLFRAIGKEQISAACGAKRRCVDVLGRNSSGEQLSPVGLYQIEKYFFGEHAVTGSASSQEEQWVFLADWIRLFYFPEQFAPVFELGLELSSHLWANVITAPVDTWPNSRAQIAGSGAEPAKHLAHTFFHDAFHRPAPARMKHADRRALCVHQDHGQAIRRKNCEQDTRCLGDQAIAGKLRARNASYAVNEVRVYLTQGDKWPRAASAEGAQSPQKARPVAFDGGAGIFPGESQIQRPASISFRNAAGPRAEAVDQPRDRLKRSSLQDFVVRLTGNFQRHRNILATSLPSVTRGL